MIEYITIASMQIGDETISLKSQRNNTQDGYPFYFLEYNGKYRNGRTSVDSSGDFVFVLKYILFSQRQNKVSLMKNKSENREYLKVLKDIIDENEKFINDIMKREAENDHKTVYGY